LSLPYCGYCHKKTVKVASTGGDTSFTHGGNMNFSKHVLLKYFCIAVSCSSLFACKKSPDNTAENGDADVAFAPVAVGAAYGVSVAVEAAVAASAVYAIDCTRPVAAGEVRFFCEGGMKLGQAAVGLVVRSVQSLTSALHWSTANVLDYLRTLAALRSNTLLKSALIGTSAQSGIATAKISPAIPSESGRKNLAYGVKQSVRIEDRQKRTCNYVAQYEARLMPRDYKGNWMSGTSMRFFARAPSAESAEAMALHLCEEYSTVHFKVAPGVAGIPRNTNACRKPSSSGAYKEKYRTADIACPGVRACSSETDCFDLPL
jgi:hypothetical protein